MTVQELTTLAHHTLELYHEFFALGIFEKNYLRKLEEVESLQLPQRVLEEHLYLTRVKHQRKVVRSWKKKSIWSKSFEEASSPAFVHYEAKDELYNGLPVSMKKSLRSWLQTVAATEERASRFWRGLRGWKHRYKFQEDGHTKLHSKRFIMQINTRQTNTSLNW